MVRTSGLPLRRRLTAAFLLLAGVAGAIVVRYSLYRSEDVRHDAAGRTEGDTHLTAGLEAMGARLIRNRDGYIDVVAFDDTSLLPSTFELLSKHTFTELRIRRDRSLDERRFRPIASLASLQRVFIEDCPKLTGRALAPLSELPLLKKLTIISQPLSTDAFDALSRCARLETLYLIDVSNVTAEGVQQLRTLPQLYSVSLAGDKLDHGTLVALSEVSSLRALDLSSASFANQDLHTLASLPNLQRLDLTRTSIDDGALVVLSQMSAIEVLILDRTCISSSGVAAWQVPGSLHTVSFKGTQVDADTVALFRQRHPGCVVER